MKKIFSVLLIVLLMMGTGITPIVAGDELVWEEIKIPLYDRVPDDLFGGPVIFSIIHDDGQFVAVGSEGNIITSPDSQTWIRQEVTLEVEKYHLSDVVRGKEAWVVIGSILHPMIRERRVEAVILTSPDTIDWTVEKIGAPYDLTGITYADNLGKFVAVGSTNWIKRMGDGTRRTIWVPVILTSRDGKIWTPQNLPQRKNEHPHGTMLLDITYGKGTLVAVGYPDALLTSRDGVSWQWQETGTHDMSLERITFGDDTFVIVTKVQFGSAPILTSKDAVSWIVRRMPVVNAPGFRWDFSDITFGKGMFVALSAYWDFSESVMVTAIATSQDRGVTWSHSRPATRGWAIGYGDGLFVVGNSPGHPGKMFVARAMLPRTILQLQIGSQNLMVERGDVKKTVLLDAVPEIPTGTARTFLPIRPVVEALGGQIFWHAEEQRVNIQMGSQKITLWINNPIAHINGTSVQIDAANPTVQPYIAPPGRTMLPLRFIAEALGAEVLWDGDTRTITITYPKP